MADETALSASLRQAFALESEELLRRLTAALLELEHADPEAAEALRVQLARDLHTLKGAASAVGLAEIKQVTHAFEDWIALPETDLQSQGFLDIAHEIVQFIGQQARGEESKELATVLGYMDSGDTGLDAVPSEVPTAAPDLPQSQSVAADPPASAQSVTPVLDESIRVPTQKLEGLQSAIGELVVVQLQHAELHTDITNMRQMVSQLQNNWRKLVQALQDQDSDSQNKRALERRITAYGSLLKQSYRQVFQLANRSAGHVGQLGLVSDALDLGLRDIRMMPVRPFLESFGMAVREAARALGKSVRLEIQDAGIEADRLVLEKLRDPLLHLLRNAVAHGIESPEARQQAGKEAVGLIRIVTRFEGEHITLSIRDDGNGIDAEAIRSKALARNMAHEDDEFGTDQLLSILCTPGFSTSDAVNEVSGRGVGMDVVLGTILDLRGSLKLDYMEGAGTSFDIRVPASVTTTDGLILQAHDMQFGLPLDAVERIIRVQFSDIQQLESRNVIYYDGEPITISSLGQLLSMPEESHLFSEATPSRPALIVRVGTACMAILVHDIPGEMPMIVKPIGAQFQRLPWFAGGAIRADGSVLPVLEPRQLLQIIHRDNLDNYVSDTDENAEAKDAIEVQTGSQRQTTVLVVDDSITTRTLERNILEAAGYNVIVATDGEEALQILRTDGNIDLLVTDLQMPRMGGRELCRQVRKSSLAALPIIMVTSIGDDDEKRQGLEAGADAYIVKGNFQQDHFLGTVRKFVG